MALVTMARLARLLGAAFLCSLTLAAVLGMPALALAAGTGDLNLPTPLPSVSIPPLPTPSLPLPTPSLPVPTPSLPLPTPSLPVPRPSLPVPTPSLPLPTPTLPAPTPTLPVSTPSLPGPSPTVPVVSAGGPSPSPSARPSPVVAGGPSPVAHVGALAGSGPSRGSSGGGYRIPFTSLTASPIDAALLAAVAILPLLFGLWMLVFGRTWSEARRGRDAKVRLALAADLGINPHELSRLSTDALFKLREQAAFDELTGVHRRASGVAATDREIARARRQKLPLSVVFVDVNGLKETNDRGGHAAGDALLKNLAGFLKAGLRGQDLVFRYGGDEFVCVLPETAEASARSKLAQIQAEAAAEGVSFCVGVAEYRRSDDVVSLLGRADQELYARKSERGVIRQLPDATSPKRRQPRPALR